MRLAHISDLHFSTTDDIDTNHCHSDKLLAAAERTLVELSPHYLIVSGDISNSGDAKSLQKARDWLTSRYSYNGTESTGLEYTPQRLGLVPGNHDAWNSPRPTKLAIQTSIKEFLKVFEDCVAPPHGGRALSAKGLYYRWLSDGDADAFLVFVDSSWLGDPGALPSLDAVARGQLAREQLVDIESLFEQGRRGLLRNSTTGATVPRAQFRRAAKIVVMHHYIFEPLHSAYAPLLSLRDRRRVFQTLAAAGTDILLCGHKHQTGFDRHDWAHHFNSRAASRLLLHAATRRFEIDGLPFHAYDVHGRPVSRDAGWLARFWGWFRRRPAEEGTSELGPEHDTNTADEFLKAALEHCESPNKFRAWLRDHMTDLREVADNSEAESMFRKIAHLPPRDRKALARCMRPLLARIRRAIRQNQMFQCMAGSLSKMHDGLRTGSRSAGEARSFNYYELERAAHGNFSFRATRYQWDASTGRFERHASESILLDRRQQIDRFF